MYTDIDIHMTFFVREDGVSIDIDMHMHIDTDIHMTRWLYERMV